MDFSKLGFFVLLMLPFIAMTEVSRIVAIKMRPADQRPSISSALSSWRPWFYAAGILAIMAGSFVEQPWSGIVYGGVLVAIPIAEAIVALK